MNPFSCLACLQLIYVGDGKCHDFTNNPTCVFDGGDCCLPLIDYEECILCKCIGINDVVNSNPIIGKIMIKRPWINSECTLFAECLDTSWGIGDGNCDDTLNVSECGFGR